MLIHSNDILTFGIIVPSLVSISAAPDGRIISVKDGATSLSNSSVDQCTLYTQFAITCKTINVLVILLHLFQ